MRSRSLNWNVFRQVLYFSHRAASQLVKAGASVRLKTKRAGWEGVGSHLSWLMADNLLVAMTSSSSHHTKVYYTVEMGMLRSSHRRERGC